MLLFLRQQFRKNETGNNGRYEMRQDFIILDCTENVIFVERPARAVATAVF